MSLSDFFVPIKRGDFETETGFFNTQMGHVTDVHADSFPDLEDSPPHIAIFGVLDDRQAVGNAGAAAGPDIIRKHFYKLYHGDYRIKIADLGNILAGSTPRDTHVAVKTVSEELMKSGIIPVVLGGGQDITYAQYAAYEKMEQKVEVAIIDPTIDIDQENTETAPLNSKTFLNHIILHEPDFLFCLSNVAYQSYFAGAEAINMYDKLYFNTMRMGMITGKVDHAEPLIRSADLVSFDVGAIRAADAPGNANASPNGLYGDDACQLCRYAGISDKLTAIGFYEYNPSYDQRELTAQLVAQMVWCFVDGYYSRKNDAPPVPKSSYITYRTTLESDAYELVFMKSKKSDRWWMQVPYFGSTSVNERYYLVPCRYEDYQQAVAGEMPDLWWKTHQKLQ